MWCYIAIFILSLLIIAQHFFTRVSGESMYPTFKEGDILLVRPVFPKFEKPKNGKIYMYYTGADTRVIKRLLWHESFTTVHYNRLQWKCHFEGDNKPCSYDSRHYGMVSWSRVKYKAVKVLFNIRGE